MEQPRNAQRQLQLHHSVLVIQHPSFRRLRPHMCIYSTMEAFAAGEATTTDNLEMEHPMTSTSPPSSDINLGSGYTAIGISAGGGHTCAMLNDGDMKCWGARGGGQLGDNSNFASGDQLTPVMFMVQCLARRRIHAIS